MKVAYYDILDAYPNHPRTDRTDFIVWSHLNGQEVTNSDKPIKTTWAMLASYWFRQVRGMVVTVLAGLAPALLYFLL